MWAMLKTKLDTSESSKVKLYSIIAINYCNSEEVLNSSLGRGDWAFKRDNEEI